MGVGCVRPGSAYNCMGSSSWIALTVKEPVVDPEMRTMNWAHCVPGYLHPSGTMQTAGSSFKWLAEQLCGEEAASYLTPEPDFSFFLDYEKGILYCRCRVTYGERNLILKPASGGGDEAREEDDTLTEPGSGEGLPELKHDTEQERRVGRVLREYFTQFSHRSNRYRKEMDEEEMFDFLVNGIPVLSRYGTVQGTDAFRRQKVRPVPQISVGVSVQSGIMDLSVTSRDVSREELLDILEGYQLRRRYHRLKSGEYIDLSQSEGLDSVGALLS